MAHELTWQFSDQVANGQSDTNQNQAAYKFWFIIQFLLGRIALKDASGAVVSVPGGTWTLEQCCDSVTVATDGTDLFGAVFNTSKFVWRFGSGIRSWAVLKAPAAYGGNFWLGLELAQNGSNWNADVKLYGHWNQPTGGTTGGAPTSTRQITAQRNLGPNTGGTAGSAVPRTLMGILATNGSFCILESANGSGLFTFSIGCLSLTELRAGDLYGFGVVFCEYASSGCLRDWDQSTANGQALLCDNTGADLGWFAMIRSNAFTASIMLGTGPDPTDGLYTKLRVYVMPVTRKSVKGRVQDFVLTSQAGDGSVVLDANNSITDIIVGNVLMPGRFIPIL